MSGEPLLSKIIDENNVGVLTRFQVVESDFPTEGEREAYRFILQYAKENRGQAPSYAAVSAECADFTYIPEVSDSYEYLVRKLKDTAGKRRIAELINEKVGSAYESQDSETFIRWLTDELESIKMGTCVRDKVGTDVATDYNRFIDEYQDRKAGKSFKLWRSKFPSINDAIGGGYYSSNMYTWYARSGRGKSVITMEEAIEGAFQGAQVLVWAMEMGSYEWLARAYASISARQGVMKAYFNGLEFDAGFETRAIMSGKLNPEFEQEFMAFLPTLNDAIPGRIVVRAVDDGDFSDRSIQQLESDISELSADIVVIDPFYYMDYEKNTSRTTGGDAAATSEKLRLLAGRTGVVIHAITQADEDAEEKDDEGKRTLRPPKRGDVLKTKQLLQDATNLFSIDTLAHEGRGVIEIGKGRSGGEDTRVEIVYLPGYGIVREMDAGDEAAKFAEGF